VQNLIHNLVLITILSPLSGSLIAGLMGKKIGRSGAHWITILLMMVSFFSAAAIFKCVVMDGVNYSGVFYTWGISGSFQFDIGFLIDRLSSVMLLIVTFVSLLVHIYSVGYMQDDPGYQRFFSYVSLFTFAMLMLVSANNFLQLYFGWEGVGLASYLLIGFWFKKESAARGSFKAFLVNRVGDFGFILGIAAIMDSVGSLNYATVFAHANVLAQHTIAVFPGTHWPLIDVACILLFVGAMGKSAQVPLHVWLPESMEGPTPISALIHAATMVTAGIFMVARMSPLYEFSQLALSFILMVGATGALFLGFLAFVENDIKRIIAYSTMSQLGYMMAANGASAFSAGIFHLLTHACFKALLFLAAGSVIIAMHHEQDIRKMGNLKKYLPVTYITFLVGALSLAAIPPFSGFYSKEAIIEAVHLANIPGAQYAYICLLIGSFVTAFYIFRAFFLTFHTQERIDKEVKSHLKEHWVMLVPLILLAIPSIFLGGMIIYPILYDPGLIGSGVYVAPQYNVLAKMAEEYHSIWKLVEDAFSHLPLWFAVSGVFGAWLTNVAMPQLPALIRKRLSLIYKVLAAKYGFDDFNQLVFVRGTRVVSQFFYYVGDLKIIDHHVVNASGRSVTRLSKLLRKAQSGYLYHYAFVMILGLLGFLIWMVL